MNKHFRNSLLAAAALGLSGIAAAAAGSAQEPDGVLDPDSVQVRSEIVRYDAAGIDDPRDAERLFFRIRKAAADVCSIASHPVGYERWVEHECEAEAVEDAVRATDIPELNDFYFRRR